MIIRIKPEAVEYSRSIQGLCTRPYYAHSKGCPNYRKKNGCPPNQPLIDKVLDFNKDLFLIYTEFNIRKHAKRMRKMHPEWTERQIYNCRLWQPTARKMQRQEEERARKEHNLTDIIGSPEAHGVKLPRRDSIAYRLIKAWMEHEVRL